MHCETSPCAVGTARSEYGSDKPAAYALLLLPAYVGAAWLDHRRETPLFVSVLPRSITIGFRKSF